MSPRPGRDFELLVARIEQRLAPHGATVTSPDYIKDRITGKPREVDASIRLEKNGQPYLITIECRDHRKGRQDDRWVEQLITKREKIGADRTIAVSSSGFSSSAIQTARAYGIDLRVFHEITDEEIAREWASGLELSFISTEFVLDGISFVGIDGHSIAESELNPNLMERLGSDALNTELVMQDGIDYGISAHDLLGQIGEPQELKEDGKPARATITLDIHAKHYYVKGMSGPLYLSRVAFHFEFWKRRIPAPIERASEYRSDIKSVIQTVNARTEVGGERLNIEIELNIDKPFPPQRPRRRKKYD